MTNGNKRDYRKEFSHYLDLAHQEAVIGQGLESLNANVVPVADQARNRFSLEGLLNDPDAATGRPLYTSASFASLSQHEQEQATNQGFAKRRNYSLKSALDTLVQHPEVFVDKDGKLDSNLTKLALHEEIRNSADQKFRPLIQDYGEYLQYSSLLDLIKEGKPLPSDADKLIRENIYEGAFRLEYDALKKKGYNDGLAKQGAEIAGFAARFTATQDQVAAAMEKLKDDAKVNIQNKTKVKDVDQSIAAYVADTLSRMASSGNPDKEQKALSLYHLAQRGYSLGGQDFAEAYARKK